jgi:hypothetical protein
LAATRLLRCQTLQQAFKCVLETMGLTRVTWGETSLLRFHGDSGCAAGNWSFPLREETVMQISRPRAAASSWVAVGLQIPTRGDQHRVRKSRRDESQRKAKQSKAKQTVAFPGANGYPQYSLSTANQPPTLPATSTHTRTNTHNEPRQPNPCRCPTT